MNIKKLFFLLILVISSASCLLAQKPTSPSSGDIFSALEKLKVLGSVLYIAAHPDDENTRLISYFSNHDKANTTYLSLTRGDGGQNLLGSEIQEELGVIRTQELLMAREIDGGNQLFSRANDFGYSKSPEETFAIWDKEKVLADVVWAIRTVKPDVIINRFDHRTPGRSHGHHTASAMLTLEAYKMASDHSKFSKQLDFTDVWKPARLFMNTSWWFYGSRENFEKSDKSNLMSVDIGVFYPLIGKSNTEIAAEARSMHKCQGFGSVGTRGSELEYLEILEGSMPENKKNIFEGINTSWTRVQGGKPIEIKINTILQSFDFTNPSKSVPALVQLLDMIENIEDQHWKKIKSEELKEIISRCAGLYLESSTEDAALFTPGENIRIINELINRSNTNITLKKVSFMPWGIDSSFHLKLENNIGTVFEKSLQIPADQEDSSPYWLKAKGTAGLYRVNDQTLIGKAESEPPLSVVFTLEIEDKEIQLTRFINFKKRDPIIGALYKPVEIIPAVSVKLEQEVYIFADTAPKTIQVRLRAGNAGIKGTLKLTIPENWTVSPDSITVTMDQKGEESIFSFELFPPESQEENFIVPSFRIGDKTYTKKLTVLEYDHIHTQAVVMDATAKIVKIDLLKKGENIAYIMGAGDQIPDNLRQVGYQVSIIPENEIGDTDFTTFDAVIMGVRAYNTVESLKFHQKKLLEYVKTGGTMIVQYNTSRGLVTEDLGPYPITLGRGRVSDENAEVRMINPESILLQYPNKITSEDFKGWIQERGLYFPEKYDERYAVCLSSNDPGENAMDGGMLITNYGEGYYIYSAYSWFRELPAGVPGAYRIFANMISVGYRDKP